MAETVMNTEITYMYRDADNYKVCHSVVLSGMLTEAGLLKISSKLEMGGDFIPSQVGLPELQGFLGDLSSADDVWHEWVDAVHTEEAVDFPLTVDQLVERFEVLEGWDAIEAAKKLGLDEIEEEDDEEDEDLE